jgi:hypothetical protein
MSLGRPVSLNDEVIEIPKIRRDQRKRCSNIVRTNADYPIIALGLVRDYLKTCEGFKSAQITEDQTQILAWFYSPNSKMTTQYSFDLVKTPIIETPTML